MGGGGCYDCERAINERLVMIADTQCRFLEGVFFGLWDRGPIGPIPKSAEGSLKILRQRWSDANPRSTGVHLLLF